MFETKCSYCGKVFLKELRRINESVKRGWKSYCSLYCQYKAKTKAKKIKCGNPDCNKSFFRTPHEVSSVKKNYCSNSCSAIVNNSIRIRKYLRTKRVGKYFKKWKTCAGCNKKFYGTNKKYCSQKCFFKLIKPPKPSIKVTKEQIIKELVKFYKDNKRIPLKIEYFHARAARNRFGTWNNAIVAAGFKPNPVRFAMKYIAKDGHKCDSLAEKIIDDWLFARKIKHEVKVSYGINKMTADFKVDGTYIEFFGLKGEVERYDELVSIKEKLWKQKNLKVISIYPDDLFPKSRLDEVFKKLRLKNDINTFFHE